MLDGLSAKISDKPNRNRATPKKTEKKERPLERHSL